MYGTQNLDVMKISNGNVIAAKYFPSKWNYRTTINGYTREKTQFTDFAKNGL